LVGYIAALTIFSLAISAKTPVYAEIVNKVRQAPLPSAVLGAPLIFLMGIFINLFRNTVQIHLFRMDTYKLTILPSTEFKALQTVILNALPSGFTRPSLNRPGDFDRVQTQVDSEFNPYQSHERWLYDLLMDLIPISSFGSIVVLARWIAFSLSGLDWLILLFAGITLLLCTISIPRLRFTFTIRDVTIFVSKYQQIKEIEAEQ
jgi:hypothetical protein